jgi:hypothetical protein
LVLRAVERLFGSANHRLIFVERGVQHHLARPSGRCPTGLHQRDGRQQRATMVGGPAQRLRTSGWKSLLVVRIKQPTGRSKPGEECCRSS